MSTWIAQHFLNPAFFWSGVSLISVPILIHLIHRLRYRRVRFAAMEFLLASEQRNRKRILFEQLLLLLLRILIVLLLLALIGRFLWDAATWSFLRSTKTHHIILLDDSGSMDDRLGDSTAFTTAKSVIQRIVSQGAERPGTQLLSLVLMTRPTETIVGFSSREISEALQLELASLLADLQCTRLRVDPAQALEGVRARIDAGDSDDLHLHVLSDFRRGDWFDNQAVVRSVEALTEAGVTTRYVRCVAEPHDNLAITMFRGEGEAGVVGVPVQTAAVGIPIQFEMTVRNFGPREARNVEVAVHVDGVRIPMTRSFQTIAAGEEVHDVFPVTFDRAGHHRLEVSLPSDSLEQDNVRYLAIDIPVENPILIIDGTPGGNEGQYLADALAADRTVTGYAPEITGLDALRRLALDKYLMIYLINVPEIPLDGVEALQRYVSAGGGLAWFLGDGINPDFYNSTLYRDGNGLFPCRIDPAPRRLVRNDVATPGPDIVPTPHPLFSVLTHNREENPFIDQVFINVYYPVNQEWREEVLPGLPQIREIAHLKNRDPLFYEHPFGNGRVVTCLSAAGPLMTNDGLTWTNWADGPGAASFAVLQLELVNLLARGDRVAPEQLVGEPLEATLPALQYLPEIEVITPSERVLRILATDQAWEGSTGTEDDETSTAGVVVQTADESGGIFHAVLRETEEPGIYVMRLNTQGSEQIERWISFNVSPLESSMELAEDADLQRELAGTGLRIYPAGDLSWIQFDAQGQEPRWWILGLLALILLAEQMLGHRLSYHPD